MTEELTIDLEFRDLIPPLTEDERAGLEANILEHGCRQPLDVWGGVIIDGHNRYAICTEHDIPFDTREVYFQTRSQALQWIIRNQFDRRNLTPLQRMDLARILESEVGAEAKARQLSTLKQGDKSPVMQNSAQRGPTPEQSKTRNQMADIAGVSHDTYTKHKAIRDTATPELNEAYDKGEVSTHLASKATTLLTPEEQREAVETGTVRETVKAHVAHNSGNNEWYTPEKFIEAARLAMGSIDTDPASCELANRTVKAGTFYDMEADGLTQEWHGNVWMNPPYSQPLILDFAKALAAKYVAHEFEQAIVLVNNATETEWFQTMFEQAAAVCFPKGRVKFLDINNKPIGAPLQGQAILYFGNMDGATGFREAFQEFGQTWVRVD